MSAKHEFITVEKIRMSRCLWCGTLESQDWIEAGRSPGYYCSRDCARAGNVEFRQKRIRILKPCGIILVLVGIVTIPLFNFDLVFTVITSGISMLGDVVYRTREISKGQEIMSHVPKDSRKDDRPLDLVLLERAKISALCPNCGANLFLAKIGPDRIFKCVYCGAEGIIEWPPDDDVPEQERTILL
jgi:ribosomal protein S27AE